MAGLRDHLRGDGKRKTTSLGPSNKKVGGLAVVLVLLILGAIGIYLQGESAKVVTDPITLCATDKQPNEHVVLLLDLSDGYSEPQHLQIRNELSRAIMSVPKLGLIEAYAVDRTGMRITRPLMHLCNPGSEKDVNQIYQNPKQAKERWIAFSDRLDKSLEQLMSSTKASTSPIFEAVQSVALQSLNAPKYDGVPKKLIVVSDLLQNVPNKLSQYRDAPTFEAFKSSAYFADVRADLMGAEVRLLYLVRPETPQDPQHIQFWEQYFVEQGGRVTEVIPIYGAH